MDPDAGTADKMQEGNVLGDKEVLSQDERVCRPRRRRGTRKNEQVVLWVALFGSLEDALEAMPSFEFLLVSVPGS